MTDLNPGIRRTVAWLNGKGWTTTDSGDGETHDFECDRPNAYVVIRLKDPETLAVEAHRLLVALREEQGINLEAVNDDGRPCLQASYDPANGLALLDLMNVSDKLLR